MALRLNPLGCLIYAAMSADGLAFLGLAAGFKRVGRGLFAAGFLAAAAAFSYRWHQVGHAPLQGLFEVFLCLGMLSYPLSAFVRRFLEVGGEALDPLIGFVVLLPCGFVFSAAPQTLPPGLQSGLFVPHVMAYMLAYVVLLKAGVEAARHLLSRTDGPEVRLALERGTYRLVSLGFPLLTLGLVLGAVWGKMAWGDYWHWDPKELWALATWLVYLGYVQFRRAYGTRHPRVSAVLALSGAVCVLITLSWVNLGRVFAGLHSHGAGVRL